MNNHRLHGRIATSVAAAISLATLPAAVDVSRADEIKPEEKKGWESVASVGLTLTRGNSENFLATADIKSARKWTDDELLLGASAGYGETTDRSTDNTVKTEEFVKGYVQWNHLFTQRLYAGLKLDGLYDNVAGVDYRFTVSPVVGYYFLKRANTFLSAEIGPSFIYEQLHDEDSHGYFAARLGQRYEYKFANGAKIWESFEFLPQVDDFENYLINVEAGVSAPITKQLDVRLTFLDNYDNRPAPGRVPNDIKLIAGLGFRF